MAPRDGFGRAIHAVEVTAASLLAAVTAITFVSVILRYLFSWSIPDGFDIGRNLLGILIFWGIALAGFRGDHIAVDILWNALGSRARRAMDLFATLVTLACMAVFAWMLAVKVISTAHDNVRTFDLQVPVWPYFLVGWLGIAAAVLLLVLRVWHLLTGGVAALGQPAARD
jgi:TRAP-type C4-dicarboxylate transport system permease small subunit